MQDSKAPTLSLGPKRTKVFGKPPQNNTPTGSSQNTPTKPNNQKTSTPKQNSAAKAPKLLIGSVKPTNDTPKKSSKPSPAQNIINKKPEISDQIEDYDSYEDDDEEPNSISESNPVPPASTPKVKMTINQEPRASGSSAAGKNASAVSSAADHISEPSFDKTSSVHSKANEKAPSVHSKANEKAPSVSSSTRKSQDQKNSVNKPVMTMNINSAPAKPAAPTKTSAAPTKTSAAPTKTSAAPTKTSAAPAKPHIAPPPKQENAKLSLRSQTAEQDFTGDDESSYDYSPVGSPRRNSPQKNGASGESVVSEILPLVKTFLETPDQEKLKGAAEKLVDWEQKIVSLSAPLEKSQQQLWFTSLSKLLKQQNLSIEKEQIAYYDQITLNARDCIQHHRFSFPGGTTHRFKLAVIGPNASGKSTYISILAQQLLLELISSGEWKKTFVFPIDVSSIAHLCQDLGGLFQAMAELSIQALGAQKPLLIPYIDGLTQTFESIVTGKPLLPKSFIIDEDFRQVVPQLQQLIDICYQCYHDSTSMAAFAVNIFMLPYFLGNIFGFTRYIVVADHFDLADVTKTAEAPFEDSNDNLFIAEIFKYLLNESSYIVGAKFNSALMEALASIENQNTSFPQGIEFLSTLGIVEPLDNNESFNITFESEEEQAITLNSESLGGCALFLKKWDEILQISRKIEEEEKKEQKNDKVDIEEEKLNLINRIQAMLKQLMLMNDNSPYNLSVKSATPLHSDKQ